MLIHVVSSVLLLVFFEVVVVVVVVVVDVAVVVVHYVDNIDRNSWSSSTIFGSVSCICCSNNLLR